MTFGCVTAANRTPVTQEKEAPGPELRDVPFQARAGRDIAPRKRVMVLPFLDAGIGRGDKILKAARESLVKSLLKSDEFVVVSQNDFPRDVSVFLRNGEYDLEGMAHLGESIGLMGLIEGKVLEVKARKMGDEVGLVRQLRVKVDATVQLRLVSTKTGHVLLNETRSASIEDSTTRIAERAVSDRMLEDDPQLVENVVTKAFQTTLARISQAVDKLAWEGRIALIKGDRVFVNAGRLTGLQKGDILKVLEQGEDVYDPETGALIGRVPGRLKGTLEVFSYFGKDGAVSVIHSGSGFKENDIVEMY